MASTSQVRTSAILLSLMSVKHDKLRSLSELKWHHIRNKFGENRSTNSQFKGGHTQTVTHLSLRKENTLTITVWCCYCYYEKVSDAERVSRKK